MSNVVKAIMATDTGERKFIKKNTSQLFQDVFNTREDSLKVHSPEIGIVYKIGVTLGATAFVPDFTTLQEPRALDLAVRRTKEQVIEAIFGEFRSDFRQIEMALYNFEHEKAGKLLYDMERKMFGVE